MTRRKAERVARAIERKAARDARTPQEQIDLILDRPGHSDREYKRLIGQLQRQKGGMRALYERGACFVLDEADTEVMSCVK